MVIVFRYIYYTFLYLDVLVIAFTCQLYGIIMHFWFAVVAEVELFLGNTLFIKNKKVVRNVFSLFCVN